MATASSSDAAVAATWPRHDSSEIRVVPSCDQRRKPKTATPTYQTCSSDCIGNRAGANSQT